MLVLSCMNFFQSTTPSPWQGGRGAFLYAAAADCCTATTWATPPVCTDAPPMIVETSSYPSSSELPRPRSVTLSPMNTSKFLRRAPPPQAGALEASKAQSGALGASKE